VVAIAEDCKRQVVELEHALRDAEVQGKERNGVGSEAAERRGGVYVELQKCAARDVDDHVCATCLAG
jgi:hypothetical protein